MLFSQTDSWVLKITKKNGESWKYNTLYKNKASFYKLVERLKEKIAKEDQLI